MNIAIDSDNLKNGLYEHLQTSNGLKYLSEYIIQNANDINNKNLDIITTMYDIDQIKHIMIPFINYYSRHYRSINHKIILIKLIIGTPLLKVLLFIEVILNPNNTRNILNTFFTKHTQLLYSNINSIVELFEPLLNNLLTRNATIELIEIYSERYFNKSSLYSIIYNLEEIHYITDEPERKSILYTIFIIALHNRYPNIPELELLSFKLLEYSVIDYIEELELRQIELVSIIKMIEKKPSLFLNNNKIVLEKRIELLNNINHLCLVSEINLLFHNTINSYVINDDYTDEEFILNYITYKQHNKMVDMLDTTTINLICNIFNKNYNIVSIYLIEQSITLLTHHLFYKKRYFNYNQELIINNMKSNRKKWIRNLFHIFDKIMIRQEDVDDEVDDDDNKYNMDLVKIINKVYSLHDKPYTTAFKPIRNIITHYSLLNTAFILNKIKNIYKTYNSVTVFNIHIKEQLTINYINICNNILLLYNINDDYKLLLSYENRNIFIELLNTIMNLFVSPIWYYTLTVHEFCEKTFLLNMNMDLPPQNIMGMFNFKDIFLHFIERFIYNLLEYEYYTLSNVYIKDIIEFDAVGWKSICTTFTNPMFLNVFIENIIFRKYKEEDIDDSRIDPLSLTMITEPICLTNNIILDKYTIYRHLIKNNYNPFTREHLTVDILNEYNKTPIALQMLNEYYTLLLNL